MPRLSIEITQEQHQHLKAIAALNSKSIKDFVLERILPSIDKPEETEAEKLALKQLEDFLLPRIEELERGELSDKSVLDIMEEARVRNRNKT